VPPPEDRERLVTQSHAQLGHYGAGRTLSLLQNSFWWPGMARQVKAHVARCLPCDRTRSRLAEVKQELQSLPLVEMGMRWSLDFAGNLPVTARGNRYVLVLVDHASKWAEAEATPDKSAETVKRVFLQSVLARFGGCREVLTDQGREFRGSLRSYSMSWGSSTATVPAIARQTNGLAEKLVSTIKGALRSRRDLCPAQLGPPPTLAAHGLQV